MSFPEALFDADHPGHYFRRLRSVALTVPCVTGPYTGVNATLTLGTSAYRTTTAALGFLPPRPRRVPGRPRTTPPREEGAGGDQHGAERRRPLRRQPARRALAALRGSRRDQRVDARAQPPRITRSDLTTITDVVFHVRYTARQGDNAGRCSHEAQAEELALDPGERTGHVQGRILRLLQPGRARARRSRREPLTPPLRAAVPVLEPGQPEDFECRGLLRPEHPGPERRDRGATFGPQAGPAAPISLAPDTSSFPGQPSVTLTASWSPVAPATPVAPGVFTLALPVASVPTTLATAGGVQLEPIQRARRPPRHHVQPRLSDAERGRHR